MGCTIANAFITLILTLATPYAIAQDIDNFNFDQHVEKIKDPNQADFIVASALTWGESHKLIRSSDSKNFDVDSTMLGTGLSYRHESLTKQSVASYEIGAMVGQVNSESRDNSLTYHQRGAQLVGGSLTVGYAYRPVSKDVSFGVAIPFLVRKVDFAVPQSGYEFNSTQKTSAHLALEMTWNLYPRLSLIQRISHPLEGGESLWVAALGLRL